MGSSETQGDLWGRAPEGWAEIQEPMHAPLWEAMLDGAGVGRGSRFLDVGCGGGGACVLADNRGAEISGLDAAEGLVNLARQRLPGGSFYVGDIESLPFEDDGFDAVFLANSIQYAEDRSKALRESGRVCQPEGRVVAGLFGPPNLVEFRRIFEAARDAMPEAPKGGGPFELSAPGKLEALVEGAGLRITESGEVNCPFRYPDLETFWRAIVSAGPFQGMLEVVGEEVLEDAAKAAAEPFLLDDGTIFIGPNVFRFVVATS